MQQGVTETGAAIEEAALEPIKQQELQHGASRQTIEERLLVQAALVKVPRGQGDSQRGMLQSLAAVDQLRFQGGVTIMAIDPVRDALRKRVVIERTGKLGNVAVDLDHLINRAGVTGAFRTHQADIEGRDLRVPEPGVEQEVAAAKAKGADPGSSLGDDGKHLRDQGQRRPLVRIEQKHPGVAEGDAAQRGVAVAGIVVEDALMEVSACLPRTSSGGSVEVVPDAARELGSVVFETERGSLDASVDTQLEEIERGLTDRLRRQG